MPKRRDINKVKAVSKAYLNNGMDMTNALKSVGDTNLTEGSLYNKASRWRHSIELQEELKATIAQFKPDLINDIYCIMNYVEVINAKDTKTSDKVNALNGLSKVLNIARDGQQIVNIGFNIQDLKTIPVRNIGIPAQVSTI